MSLPEVSGEAQTMLNDLQVELDKRGVSLPKSLMPSDNRERTLGRFLRARKMNITAAADMLQNTVKWRTEAKIEECLETFLPDDKDNKLRRFLPSGFLGFDKGGSPVWMEHAAAIDVPGMEAAGISLEDFAMEYMVNCKYVEATEKCGHPVDSHCVILDLAGLRMSMLNQNTIKVFKSMSGIYQDHYPELMSRMFLVNIPLMFAAVWKVLQMFVDDRVKAKIRFLRKADFHILHEFVDRDSLPESLGGKAKEKLLSDKQGYLPPSLQAVNAEIRRRIDARDARLKQAGDKPEHSDEPMRISTPGPVEPPLTFNTHDSMPPVSLSSYEDVNPQHLTAHDGVHGSVGYDNRDSAAAPAGTAWGQHYTATQPPESFGSRDKSTVGVDKTLSERNMHTSGSASSLDSEALGQMDTPQLAPHRPVGMTDAELVKLAELKAGSQQAQHAQQPAAHQTASTAAAVPISVLAKAGSGKGAPSAEGKQRRRSKREKARGLLSSFTGGHKRVESEEDMDQAMQMLAELRRTESTPNVEAEALKRNKGGGGPWMSFTRQRRTPKPRSAKKGGSPSAGARRGSPLATVLWNPFCAHAPMVRDDEEDSVAVGMIDTRQPEANSTVPAGGFPPSASSATLTQRLQRKLSAIPAYLQTSEDPEGLRVTSPEPSGSSLSGSSASAFFLQRDVVGRYASAPDLQALAADSARQAASQPLIPDSTPARAPAPGPAANRGVGRTVSSSQASGGQQPWGGSQANGNVVYTATPMLGQSNAKAHSAYVHQVIQKHARSTAVNRQLRHGLKFLTRNWALLLVLVLSVGGLWLAAGYRSYAKLRL
ncbi:MAG: sec14 cytosolic factor [Trebouxia sp. A1-2]|nr:MAG: sec14 cytosolic factor [Trebouxia sp. A1-2]